MSFCPYIIISSICVTLKNCSTLSQLKSLKPISGDKQVKLCLTITSRRKMELGENSFLKLVLKLILKLVLKQILKLVLKLV